MLDDAKNFPSGENETEVTGSEYCLSIFISFFPNGFQMIIDPSTNPLSGKDK
jgi:hypothetical protein